MASVHNQMHGPDTPVTHGSRPGNARVVLGVHPLPNSQMHRAADTSPAGVRSQPRELRPCNRYKRQCRRDGDEWKPALCASFHNTLNLQLQRSYVSVMTLVRSLMVKLRGCRRIFLQIGANDE